MFNGRHLTHVFHSQNKTGIKRYGVCSTREYSILESTFNNEGGIHEFKNLSPGLYAFKTDTSCYMISLPVTLAGDDKLVIENRSSVYTVINGKKRLLIPYEMSASFTSKSLQVVLQSMFQGDTNANYLSINNAINGYIDMIAVAGLTTMSRENPSPYKPAELTSLGSFTIESNGILDGQHSELTINLNNNIKKLPCGRSDLFVMDAIHKESYIIYRVGRLVLTGSEQWQAIKEDNDHCIYFLPFNLISTSISNGAIISNYFPGESYDNMMLKSSIDYCIANSVEQSKPGIYIKLPTELIAETGVENFKKYLKYLVNKKNPVIIEYLSKDIRVKSVLLDDYIIPQYSPNTNINIDADTYAAFFFRTINYEDDPAKRSKQDRKLQIKI